MATGNRTGRLIKERTLMDHQEMSELKDAVARDGDASPGVAQIACCPARLS
jgi:hypothetical protein